MTTATIKGRAAYSERLRLAICEAGTVKDTRHLVAQLRRLGK